MVDRFEHFTRAIFHISRSWNRIAGEEMKKHDLKASYALYLVTLCGCGPEGISAARLGELCARDKADVSRAMSLLESRGMIYRVGENSYRAGICLTESGEELAEHIKDRAALALTAASQGISPEERQIMYTCLDTITENLEELSREGLPE